MRDARVRKLRLAAPTEGLVARGAMLLEDAFRIATLPGGDDGRQVLVRRLELGRLASFGSSTTLALVIEARYRDIASRAVHAAAPTAAGAPAVFFHDEVEACVLLAGLLARGAAAELGAWFWRLAVPGFDAGAGADRNLRVVVARVLATRAAVRGVALVVDALARGGGLAAGAFFAGLGPDDGGVLLSRSGLAPVGDARAGTPPFEPEAVALAPAIARALDRWLPVWGPRDMRSLWLAAMGAIAAAPGRAEDPRLRSQAVALCLARAAAAEARPAGSGRRGLAASAEGAADPHGGRDGVEGNDRDAGVGRRRGPAALASDGAPAEKRGDSRVVAAQAGARGRACPAPDGGASTPDESAPPAAATAPAPPPHGEPPEHHAAARSRSVAPPWLDDGAPSACAGLLFLIRALETLGIREWLRRHPAALTHQVPERILLALAGAKADDPMAAALLAGGDRLSAWDAAEAIPFTVPPAWRPLWGRRPVRMRRIAGDAPGWRILEDAAGRMPLGLWRVGEGGDVRARVRSVLRALLGRDQRVRRGAPRVPGPGAATQMIAAWCQAARRWCRRYARLPAHAIAARPGQVRATATHIDVFLPLGDAAAHVRAAGLDVDPGWVPWLGRVVLFHYRGGRGRAGVG